MMLTNNQFEANTKLSAWKVGALFMKMGTGKTRVALELANRVNDVDLLIWVGPLQSITPKDKSLPSIKDEVDKWGGFTAKEVIYIGVETIGQSDRQYLQIYNKIRHAWKPLIIVDESVKIKNMDAKRTNRLIEFSKMIEYKLILNGTPVVKDLLDLYSQINFLDTRILNMDYEKFKDTFCKYTKITTHSANYGRSYSKEFITGYENVDYLYSLIGQYIYECDLDLNVKQLYQTETYTIDDEAKEQYQYLKNKYLEDKMLLMCNNNIFLELTMKMQHIYCCTESKFEKVSQWFNTYPEYKSIIFCKFIRSAEECKRRFPKAVVLNYKTGSMSLNLQERPYTVYFDKTFDYGDVAHSKYRNYRTGQECDCRYLSLTGDVGLEKLIEENNTKKINVSEYLKKISMEQLNDML